MSCRSSPLEGPAGEVPAAPPAGLVVHRQPVALEGGQVPVEALPLGHDALLLQPGGQSGQGQGAGLVGLVVQDAGQGQGPVPLVSVMLPHHLSLLHRRPIGAVSLCFQGHYRTVVRKKQGGIRTGVRKWGLGEAVVPGSPCQGELSAKLTEGWGRCGMHDCFDRASCGVSTLSSFAAQMPPWSMVASPGSNSPPGCSTLGKGRHAQPHAQVFHTSG